MPGRVIFRHAFVPLLLVGVVLSWVERERLEGALLAGGFRIDFTSLVLLGSMLLIWFAEQLYPANAEWNYRLLSGTKGWARLGRDLLYLFGITQVSALFLKATASHLSWTIGAFGLALPTPLWPTQAPFVVKVVLAFAVVELCSYWLHRAAHRSAFLWQFHSTHHVISELGGLKAVRTHPIDNVFFYLARTTPLLLVGAGVDELIAVTYFGSLLGILAHANISVSEGWLGLIINFPRYHAVHHSSDLAQSRSNYGCHTIFWDRLFGTFQGAAEGPVQVGVRPLGERSLWQELVWPLYRSVRQLPRVKGR